MSDGQFAGLLGAAPDSFRSFFNPRTGSWEALVSDVDDLVAWLRAQLDEDEAWAKAASQRRVPGTPTGEHWHWECDNCDTPIEPDPMLNEFLQCPNCEGYRVDLRSVEMYQDDPGPLSVGPLPAFVVPSAEEVPPASAGHITRHDPARVLRDVEAGRRILDEWVAERDRNRVADIYPERTPTTAQGVLGFVIRVLAAAVADRPGYREEWRP